MNVLLDTQVLLWWTIDSPLLSRLARDVISNGANRLFLSAASAWEIAIKAQIGKLQLPDSPQRFIPQQMAQNAIESLPVHLSHALHVWSLPTHHRDPFDRMLVAQSQMENLPIVTADAQLARYDVVIIW